MVTEDDLKFLKDAGCSESVVRHSVIVAEEAFAIARKLTVPVDLNILKKGAINHDIGRSKSSGLDHSVIGAAIAGRYGFEEAVVRIIERHTGAGIPCGEAVTCGLPPKDYIPETPEEIIVSYADNLTDGVRVMSFVEALEKFRRRLGKDHPAIERFNEMHRRIQSWMKK